MLKTFLKKNAFDILLVILLGLFTYFFLVIRAPINMDEFSHYHPLICSHYENNALNTFREQCGMYDQKLLGTDIVVSLRSYGYGGSLASLYYYPLFLLWPSPASARMLGFVFVIFQALLLARLLKVRFRYTLLGIVAFFPYYYQIIIDTSIIHFYSTAIIAMVFMLKRWFETLKLRYMLLFAFILLLTFWSRLSFGLGFPALILIFIYFWVINRKKLQGKYLKVFSQLFISGTLIIIPALIYIFSPAVIDGKLQVWEELTARPSNSVSQMLDPDTYLSSVLLRRFLSPLQATERAYYMDRLDIAGLAYSLILYGLPLICNLIRFIQLKRQGAKYNLQSLLFYLMFLLTSLLLFRSADTKHMHHVMMAYPFLVLSWAYLAIEFNKISKTLIKAAAIVFILFNLYYYLTFTNQKVQIYSHSSLNEVHEILQNEYLAEKYFYVIPNWGMFFYEGLYGPLDQSVLYIQSGTDNIDVVEKLQQLPAQFNRQLLYIYDKQVPETIPDLYEISPGLMECSKTKDYEVWGILMPRDDNELNPCR